MNGSKLKVFTPEEIIKIIESSKDNLIVSKKVSTKQYKGGVSYFDIKIKDFDGKLKPLIIKIQNINIISDLPDPSVQDTRNDYNTQIETDLASSGTYGEMITKLDEAWVQNISKLFPVDQKPKIFPLINKCYSDKCPIADKRGKPFTDSAGNPNPRFRFAVNFKSYPDNYPRVNLRGKPMLDILDASKYFMTPDKKIEFAQATINNEIIKKENVHLFLKRGATIVSGRVHIESAVSHNFGISAKQVPSRLVIKQNDGVTFDEPDDDDELIKMLLTKTDLKEKSNNNERDEEGVKIGKREIIEADGGYESDYNPELED